MPQINDRIKGYNWFKKAKESITIVGGAGGIGSYLTFYLSRVGVSQIHVFDFDTIEEHNLAGQLFSYTSVGKKKVHELKDVVYGLSGVEIKPYDEAYTKDSVVCKYMFSAFDSMTARRDMFQNWKENIQKEEEGCFIDGRMLSEGFHIFCVTKDNMEEYEANYLPEDDNVQELPCTRKGNSHVAASLAAFMNQTFLNYLNPSNFSRTPFKQVINLDLFKYESAVV